jgi:hypothetical protein
LKSDDPQFAGEDGKRILGDLVNLFTVTRLPPNFDAQGEHTGLDFWLL